MEQTRVVVTAKAAGAAAAAALIAACNTITPYVPPSGTDTAKLLIRSVVPAGMAYGVYAQADPHACRGDQRIALSAVSGAGRSTQLRAGTLTTLKYVGGDRSRSCTLIISFQPKANHTYLLNASQDDSRCFLELMDATNPDQMHPEKSLVRRVLQGRECQPIGTASKSDGSGRYQGNTGADGSAQPGSRDQLHDFKDLLPSK